LEELIENIVSEKGVVYSSKKIKFELMLYKQAYIQECWLNLKIEKIRDIIYYFNFATFIF
jgi:hypothetical protein